ncbi:hypothetical protein Alches_04250 [Alicyclobacillus hesperidum subsp. aegles]|uniref:helix-turn-helix domain-containing protein n=1 Tax=Alicyclobacillus hesperidum TaxID=89784 RepID=UPI000719184C|nr:helix-turn-helix transcriptional regulator [Alicyclobacillus hesperidum]KRW92982.1 XRE family transcriptional regulator [Alicyclobacillus tengchongensis]GLG00386.1 hypothetical protein Alches_04250 [Alicyclobacillus hesperidum subsp. aegles]
MKDETPVGTLGERLAQLRKQRGLTQAKLAERANISTSAIAMYETNRRQPDDATLAELAAALEAPIAMLRPDAPIDQPTVAPLGQAVPNGPVTNTSPLKVHSQSSQKDAAADGLGVTQLALTREEARLILFVRMHPDAMPFLQTLVTADAEKRKQLEKTWRLIQAFQA